MDSTHPRYRRESAPLFDPDALITGAELALGFTFWNSRRAYRDQAHYDRACAGLIPPADIPAQCPRYFHHHPQTEGLEKERLP